MTLRPGHLLVATVATTALAACGGTSSGASADPGNQYVALGDSYAAAPGVGPADGHDGCFRSQDNYPHLVAAAAGLELVDVTCSAANTKAITEPQKTLTGNWVEAQIDAVRHTTDVVTIGIGGNDLGFYQELTNTCLQAALDGGGGASCTKVDAARPDDQKLAARLAQLEQRDVAVIRAIQDRASQARVLVVGYPGIVPEHAPCPEYPARSDDLPYVGRIVKGLNEALLSAAQQTGTTYVDVYAASRGHDVCSAEPWVAGLRATRGATVPWHPYMAEQQAVADAVQAALGDD